MKFITRVFVKFWIYPQHNEIHFLNNIFYLIIIALTIRRPSTAERSNLHLFIAKLIQLIPRDFMISSPIHRHPKKRRLFCGFKTSLGLHSTNLFVHLLSVLLAKLPASPHVLQLYTSHYIRQLCFISYQFHAFSVHLRYEKFHVWPFFQFFFALFPVAVSFLLLASECPIGLCRQNALIKCFSFQTCRRFVRYYIL